jgi:hypothetical protein
MRTLQNQAVRDETVNVLNYIAQQGETEDIVASIVIDVLHREEI